MTDRCHLEPLRPSHADAMVRVLGDPTLYDFIGGQPPTLDQLRRQYQTQTVGHSPDQRQRWCNWIVRVSRSGRAVGFVQATVEDAAGRLEADVAWVIEACEQGRGLATEAARTMIEWLGERGVGRCVAFIHPEHAASARVAVKLGMRRTSVIQDGEIRWDYDHEPRSNKESAFG